MNKEHSPYRSELASAIQDQECDLDSPWIKEVQDKKRKKNPIEQEEKRRRRKILQQFIKKQSKEKRYEKQIRTGQEI